MSTTQYLLNAVLLAFVLWANLGTRPVSRARFTLPLLLVAVAAAGFLRDVPTAGSDLTLEVVGVAAGVVLGLLAAALVRVDRDTTGRLVLRAGAPYAALWLVVIGGRCAFAYGAQHWFPRAIGEFSATHHITGADAWTAAFVLMALAMVVTRVAATGVATAVAARRPSHVLA